MTQEKKDLMLRDLCARLPHGVKVLIDIESEPEELYSISTFRPRVSFSTTTYHAVYVENIKPYLRPMSSMTEEEVKEYKKTCEYSENDEFFYPTFKTYDYLNAHHFDYRGLIQKGLALEAPKDMYNIK